LNSNVLRFDYKIILLFYECNTIVTKSVHEPLKIHVAKLVRTIVIVRNSGFAVGYQLPRVIQHDVPTNSTHDDSIVDRMLYRRDAVMIIDAPFYSDYEIGSAEDRLPSRRPFLPPRPPQCEKRRSVVSLVSTRSKSHIFPLAARYTSRYGDLIPGALTLLYG